MSKDKEDEVNPKKSGFASNLRDSGKAIVDKGVQKGKQVSGKVVDAATETVDKIDKTMKKVGQEISDELIKQTVKTSTNTRSSSRSGFANDLEKQLFSWEGWIWSIMGYVIIIFLAFTISSANSKFSLLPIILLIGFPLYILWMLYNIVPNVSIAGHKIISRDQVSLRNQLSFGKAIAKTFGREMWKNSPEMAIIITLFFILLIYAILSPLL